MKKVSPLVAIAEELEQLPSENVTMPRVLMIGFIVGRRWAEIGGDAEKVRATVREYLVAVSAYSVSLPAVNREEETVSDSEQEREERLEDANDERGEAQEDELDPTKKAQEQGEAGRQEATGPN